MSNESLIIYQTNDGSASIKVVLNQDTVWLDTDQIAKLFDRDRTVVIKHIRNIFSESELEKGGNVQALTSSGPGRAIYLYSLDVIISVGYRVKSQRGTQFRIWANNVLKEYLIKGYSLNETRLKEQAERLSSLKEAIQLMSNIVANNQLSDSEASGLLKVLTDYTYALDILDKYDHQQLTIQSTTADSLFQINYEEATKAIQGLKQKFGGSELFGNEKDESFKSSLSVIYQTFDEQELYPSVEEKAAHLLYFVIKNHSFSDGNKRIAAFLFVWFLEKNQLLYRADGTKRIADNALVALTLMIAESKPDEKEIMTKVVVNLINAFN